MKKKIIDSGISMSEIAEKIGLSKQVFSQRLKSKTIKIELIIDNTRIKKGEPSGSPILRKIRISNMVCKVNLFFRS